MKFRSLIVACVTLLMIGCRPNAREREAGSLLITAQTLESSSNDDEKLQAFNIYANLGSRYGDTSAGKRAAELYKKLQPEEMTIIQRKYEAAQDKVRRASRVK